MNYTSAISLTVLVVACHGGRAPAPRHPSPGATIVDTTILVVPADSTDTIPAFVVARRLADSAGALVRTIEVTPDTLWLRVGESIPYYTRLHIVARDERGQEVEGFAPFFMLEDYSIAQFGSEGLTGRKAGWTRILIHPSGWDPRGRHDGPEGVVVVRVR